MDKKILGALSFAALFGAGAASAQALETVMNPKSYAELLQPVENAPELLAMMEMAPKSEEALPIQKAHHHHHSWHHHHHHHHWYHHHHHHHHWGWHHHHHHFGWPFVHHHHHHW